MQLVLTDTITTVAESGHFNTCLSSSRERYHDNSEERETYGQGTRGAWADQAGVGDCRQMTAAGGTLRAWGASGLGVGLEAGLGSWEGLWIRSGLGVKVKDYGYYQGCS